MNNMKVDFSAQISANRTNKMAMTLEQIRPSVKKSVLGEKIKLTLNYETIRTFQIANENTKQSSRFFLSMVI